MEKGVDKSLRGRYNSKAVGRERQASETEVRAEGCERKGAARASQEEGSPVRGRKFGNRMFLENRIVNQEEMLERADQAQTNKSNFETTGGLSDDEVARQTQKKKEQKRELLKDFNSRV